MTAALAPAGLNKLLAWTALPQPRFVGGNTVTLLQGGDELFPRLEAAIAAAAREIWLATYIFHSDAAATRLAQALVAAAARGVAVHVVVDGFGTLGSLSWLRGQFTGTGVRLAVFRPLDRWYSWLQPGQLRRLHQKLCVCDETTAFVGGVNLIDDRHDVRHGWGDAPRLDFAVQLSGPLVAAVHATARAMWARAELWREWKEELRQLRHSPRKREHAAALVRTLRGAAPVQPTPRDTTPVLAAFLVRDNLRQRRSIERSVVAALRQARQRVDIAVPYFYPGHGFRQALRGAARRGVQVRLLLQGKVDYRIAALAARALYDELRGRGVHIHEYTPAFLHAKVVLVDGEWATIGSSNIDPLSLLLNLEANVVVRDAGFSAALGARLEAAFTVAPEVTGAPAHTGWRRWLHRGAVAWLANVYLRIAGITGRY